MGGKKPLRRPLWPPTRATASNYYPLGLDGAGGAAKPLLRAPKKPAPLHGRLPAFSGAVDAFERARKCFLEWRYFFSIILSEFLKNRVALQQLLHLRQLCTELQSAADNRYRDAIEYYTTWAHQIKTPIASMRLALQGEDTALFRRLLSDLSRTEQYVEMVMAFLRLEDAPGDYVFREVALDEVLRQALRRFSAEFIDRRLRLDYTPTGLTVLTDEKWLCFVLEQLLSNALKYTREGSITVELAGERVLAIRDTGIGIAPEDLPRIFEKGYTGQNGRADKRASGLGLYLCSRICRNLGVGLTVKSTSGVGTTLLLDFTQYPLRVE